jgi:ABC-2 type transport system ATP-binding protein
MIEVRNIHKSFGPVRAVDGISLSVAPGEIYGLVGADGAGKTTTLRLICGALRLDSEFVGLAAFKDRFAGQLSGGMKQKLGLASALVTRPTVLLLDEPTTGVDPVTRQDFWQLIIKLVSAAPISEGNGGSRRGVSVLISTPYMDEAARCHRVGFMRKGKLVAEGTPGELRSTLDGQILELRGKPLVDIRHLAAEVEGVEDVQIFGDRLHLRAGRGEAHLVMERLSGRIQAAGATLESVRSIPPTLEDVFIMMSVE